MIGSFLDAFDLFVEPQGDASVAEVVAKRFDQFLIGKFEQPGTLFDERDAHAQNGEHAGVLNANHAAANYNHGLGNFRHAEDLIAVDDGAVVERHQRRDGRLGAGREDDVLGFVFLLASRAADLDAARIEKARGAGDDVDAVARELGANHVDFCFDDVERAEGEIGHGDGFLHPVVDAINALVLIAGKMQDGFANGLAGNGAGVDGGAADDFEFFNQSGALAEFCGLDGGALACGSGTHDDEIVPFHLSRREYIKRQRGDASNPKRGSP